VKREPAGSGLPARDPEVDGGEGGRDLPAEGARGGANRVRTMDRRGPSPPRSRSVRCENDDPRKRGGSKVFGPRIPLASVGYVQPPSSLLKKAAWHPKGCVFLGDFEGRSDPD
jgi:hypothetical protein